MFHSKGISFYITTIFCVSDKTCLRAIFPTRDFCYKSEKKKKIETTFTNSLLLLRCHHQLLNIRHYIYKEIPTQERERKKRMIL